MQSLPPVTRTLLIINVVVFLIQQVAGDFMLAHFALWPLGPAQYVQTGDGGSMHIGFELWQIVTYGFLHASLTHIAFNMFALWMFGGPVENALGRRRFTIYYFVCIIGAALAQLVVIHFFKPNDFYPTLGASGGVFGLLLAFAMLYPRARLALIFIPIPVPAPIFVLGYMAIEFVLGVTGTQEGVAHFAHLGGALAGFALLRMWRARALTQDGS